MDKNINENLTNYIMSVQSLVSLIHNLGYSDNVFIDSKITVLENFEDKLLTELSTID